MKKAIKCTVFLIIAVLLFNSFDKLLVRKSLYGWWNITTKINGFFNSQENVYDVVFFGSSHAYASFNPIIIYEETGLKSYVCATQKQPLWATYYYISEALKRQNPSLVVLDCYSATFTDEYSDDATCYTYCDDFPFGINKLKMINESSDDLKKKFDLLFRFTKYHSRWNELNGDDFSFNPNELHDWLYGYCKLTTVNKNITRENTAQTFSKIALTEKNEKWLKEIISLCKNSNTKLVLVKTPDNETPEEKSYYNYISDLAEDADVDFVNYNDLYDDVGINIEQDFFDRSHLNQYGAEKFSRYVSKSILNDVTAKTKIKDIGYQTSRSRYYRELSGDYNPFSYELNLLQ